MLGTPFLFQHKALVGLNPPRLIIESTSPLPMKGAEVTTLESRAATVVPDELEKARDYYPLCEPSITPSR